MRGQAWKIWALALGLLSVACAPLDAPPPTPPAPPAAVMEEPPEPAPPPKTDPATLLGLGPADIMLMLGTPDLVRRDGHVQIHQYRHAACVLDLVFYESADNGPFLLSAIDSRDRQAQPYDGADCLALIMQPAPASSP